MEKNSPETPVDDKNQFIELNLDNYKTSSEDTFQNVNEYDKRYHSRFADVYGMNYQNQYILNDIGYGTIIDQTDIIQQNHRGNPEYVNIVHNDHPYYIKKRTIDIRTILGVVLLTLAVIAAVGLAVLPIYFLYSLLVLENQTEMAIITKVNYSPILARRP